MYLLCWRFQVEELQKQNYLSCEELQQVEFIQTIENLCSTPATRCSNRLDTSRRVLLSFLQTVFLVYLPLLLMQQYSKWCLEASWSGLGDVASWIQTLVWAPGHIFRWMRGVCVWDLLSRVLQMSRSDPESRRLLQEITQEPDSSSCRSLLDPVRLDWVRYWDRDTQSSILLSRLQPAGQFITAEHKSELQSNITFLFHLSLLLNYAVYYAKK